jgi:hypothetical protein
VPLSFESNQGQSDPRAKFLSRGNGYEMFLTPTEAVWVLAKSALTRIQQKPKGLEIRDAGDETQWRQSGGSR